MSETKWGPAGSDDQSGVSPSGVPDPRVAPHGPTAGRVEPIFSGHRVDRSRWAAGPWEDAPEWVDDASWTDEATGLSCRAWRDQELGYWHAAVSVPANHPAFALDVFAAALQFDVHGMISHVIHDQDGSSKAFAFHCGNDSDIVPGFTFEFRQRRMKYDFGLPGSYKTLAFVRAEAARLARQLKAFEATEGV